MLRKTTATITASLLAIAVLLIGGCAPATPTTPGGTPTAPAGETITWKCQCPIPTGIMQFDSWSSFATRVDAMSAGRLKINVLPGGSVVPEYEEVFAVEEGSLDAYIGQPTDNSGVLGPAADLFTQFALSPNPMEYLVWLETSNAMQLLQELYEAKGFKNTKVLAFFANEGGEEELVSTKKITSLNDYKGMKIRTYGYWGKVVERLGASVVTLPGAELYQSLKTGVIDACEYSTPQINKDMHFYEVAKFVHYPALHSPACTYFLWVNKGSWDKLPADLKAIVEEAAKAQIIHYWTDSEWESAQVFDFYQTQGVQLVEMPMDVQHAIVTGADTLWKELSASDPEFKKVYDAQQSFMQTYSEFLTYMTADYLAARAWK